jgi:hypothetical protein
MEDLQQFLGLREPIAPFIWFKPGETIPAKEQSMRIDRSFDICDDKFAKVRRYSDGTVRECVQRNGFVKYFVDAEDVVVSSRFSDVC